VRHIGRYRVEAELGRGGMGAVYRAFDEKLHRAVALKIVELSRARGPDAQAEAKARLFREARAAAALDHPSTVVIYDFGEEEGTPFIAMELIQGSTLRAFVGDPSISVEQRVAWLADVARALSAAHRAGLVHRDVKPENVMVREDGRVKVLDFGIARAADEGAKPELVPITREGVAVGTPAYMAPEQVRRGPTSARTDQFAWGVLAYELLSGKLPWGETNDALSVVAKIVADEPPPLGAVAKGVPANVVAAVTRAMAKKADERFASMEELLAELGVSEGRAPRSGAVSGAGASEGRAVVSGAGAVNAMGETALAMGETALAVGQAAFAATEALPAEEVPRGGRTVPAGPHLASLAALAQSPEFEAKVRAAAAPANAADSATTTAPSALPGATTTPSATTQTAAPSPAPARSRRGAWIAGAVGAVAIAAIVGALIVGKGGAKHGAPVTAGSARPEVIAAFEAGMREWKRGGYPKPWDEALAADPAFSPIHLRLALHFFGSAPTRAREHYQSAALHESALSPRDRAFFKALGSLVERQPPDLTAYLREMREIARADPDDDEMLYYLGDAEIEQTPPNWALAKVAYTRAITIDASFARAWKMKAETEAYTGEVERALDSVNRCIAGTPSADACLLMRNLLDAEAGRCERMLEDARRRQGIHPADPGPYHGMAEALVALGRPEESVLETLRQKWDRTRAADKKREEALDRYRLAVLRGALGEAEKIAHGYPAIIEREPDVQAHFEAAAMLVSVLDETGRTREAAKEAERFLERRDAWVPEPRADDFAVARDRTPEMLDVERRAGTLAAEAFEEKRAGWVKDWSERGGRWLAPFAWIHGYAAIASDAADAAAAARARGKDMELPAFAPLSMVAAAAGRAAFLGGDAAHARPELERAARDCRAFSHPFEHTRSLALLGRLLEDAGDKAGACGAYERVLGRWGKAEPASVTAEDARKRAAALGCGK
jgi:serine/threonine-protein kinase